MREKLEKAIDKVRIYNKSLSPELWTTPEKLNPKVRKALLQIAQAFYKDSELKAKLQDVYFLGSSANYNWTPNSDIDVHLLVDSRELGMELETAKKYFRALSGKWNQEHSIEVKGHTIELYIQDVQEINAATAVYSLLRDIWIKRPVPENVSVDQDLIQKKYTMWVDRINHALNLQDEVQLKQILDTLKKYRQSGLDRGGELSTENLVFKILRSRGDIDRIKNTYNTEFDKKMSVPEAFDPTSQGPNLDVGTGDDSVGAHYKAHNSKMRRMEEVNTKDIKQTHPKFATDDNPPMHRLTLDNLNALRAKTRRSFQWYKKHPENSNPQEIKALIDYDKKLKDEIDQRLGLINEPPIFENQSDWIGTTAMGDIKAVKVPDAKLAIHRDHGMISGINSQNWRYYKNRNMVMWNTPPTQDDIFKVTDFLSKRGIEEPKHKPMYSNVQESYGTGIPEKDRLKIQNGDGSVRRWQIRSKDAPSTPKMNEFMNKLINESLDKVFIGFKKKNSRF
jgi:predicted nucleotidyltransferase